MKRACLKNISRFKFYFIPSSFNWSSFY